MLLDLILKKSIVLLPRTLFQWHTGDHVQLALRGADSFQVIKIIVKQQTIFYRATFCLGALNNVSGMDPRSTYALRLCQNIQVAQALFQSGQLDI